VSATTEPSVRTPGQSAATPRTLTQRTQESGPARRFAALWPGVVVWALVSTCCLLPMFWIVLQLVSNPSTLQELRLDAFRIHLIVRTIVYNASVATVATALAIPAAIALGRGRGLFAKLLWVVLPISLLLPSLTFAYGWKQQLRICHLDFEPAGFADVARCIWSLATWLWPVPAVVMGLSLRRVDTNVQQQALLDGIYWRVSARQLLGPALASAAIVAVIALQEFAVYEPTGISVIATETRMVFETGAFSSPDNPITQTIAPAAGANQGARAAAAVATSLPMLLVIAVLSILAAVGVRRFSAADAVEAGAWPRSLDASTMMVWLAWLVSTVTLLLPVTGLLLGHRRPFHFSFIWDEFGPQINGSILVAAITGAIVLALALAAAVRNNRAAATIALVSFLVGGQLIAIALIRLYNHPSTVWLYQSAVPVMMAYVARFGWIVLFAASSTWSSGWRRLRDMASVDGANFSQTARHVIWPLAWPILGASALFVAALSLSEVPATVLLAPQQPQMLVPLMMTWVHMLRSDPMIEASLMTAGMVVAIGTVAICLFLIGARANSQLAKHSSQKSSKSGTFKFQSWCLFVTCGLCFVSLSISGCGSRSTPREVWLDTGTAPGQVVYPRGICYSATDDTFFIVDRAAHIQHLDHTGKFLNDWHMPFSQQGKPVGLSVGPNGNVYVPDTHYHRVMVYSPDGKLLRQWGEKGTGPGQFIYPTDIAFDAKGNVFVSEYGDNDRIQVFTREGKLLYAFGTFGDGDGQFNRPQSMVIDGDSVYVTDACNHRIVVFKTDGTWVRNMGGVGSAPGQFRFPYGLDMDRDGDLIVCEFGNNRVQKIDKQTGMCKATWGSAGREPGRLAYPWGVCVDKRDRIIAVDAGNNRLQVFEF